MTCETCPPYVSKCAHLEDGLAAWFIVTEDARKEFARRADLQVEALYSGMPCPSCGTPMPGANHGAAVLGPGQIDEPQCICKAELSCGDLNLRRFHSPTDALKSFEEVVARHKAEVRR